MTNTPLIAVPGGGRSIGDTAYERILDQLRGHGCKVRDIGSRATAQCPAHEDRQASLSLRGIEGQTLVYCHAGCPTTDVLAALGLQLADLFDERKGVTYRYDDGRIVRRTPDKRFYQQGNTSGAAQLYHLSRLQAASDGGVFLVEGEKDVHAIESAGGIATTAPMGAKNFTKVDVTPLRGRAVTVVVDRDGAGAQWAADVRTALHRVAARLRFVQAATGKDAADHIAAAAAGRELLDWADFEWPDDAEEPPDSVPEDDEEQGPSSWEPIDLTSIVDGSHTPQTPSLLPRSDGVCLLYAGRVHSLHGESESGKSMVAQAECARVLIAGGSAGYLDFESDETVVVGRLLMMGVPPEAILQRFRYYRPDADPRSNPHDRAAYARMLEDRHDVAVIDGVTEAAAVFGVVSKDNDEITKWIRIFARRLAHRTGAAVIQVDHVTKDSESRGRFAIGGGAKMNALDGSAFTVEVKEPLGVGMRGLVVLRVAKDRPGQVRPHCGPFRQSDRTQEAARIVIDSTTPGRIDVTVHPYAAGSGSDPAAHSFRPTALMEKVSRFIEKQKTAPSESKVLEGVVGKERAIKEAISLLVDEGYLRVHTGPRNAHLHEVAKRYRQVEDPLSDKYEEPLPEPGAEVA
ncbi:AAA family ATPase [Micromonospora chalcea]|uniref:toprim domain-containing protein n=1 Tax=Micromonospora chalcea TaxID=1874 RepID=UPI0021A36FEA|nr:toprim domain-containing protein [Micromonospora chalcea]MCT2278001.1 AAA family ATPase [Micromonospora chalcea]